MELLGTKLESVLITGCLFPTPLEDGLQEKMEELLWLSFTTSLIESDTCVSIFWDGKRRKIDVNSHTLT